MSLSKDGIAATFAIVVVFYLAIGSGALAETNLVLTIDGVTYEDVRFGQVRGNQISIFYRGGVATVAIGKLPSDVQQQLGYDLEKAKADAEARAGAQAKEEKKFRTAGYVNIRGKWVSPEEAGKYLDRQQTAGDLGRAITAEQITKNTLTGAVIWRETVSLLVLVRDMSTHNYEILLERQSRLDHLRRYGHPAYAKAINEFLGVCSRGIEIHRELQNADVECLEAIGKHDSATWRLSSRPISGQESAALMALGQKKAKGEAFVKRIESLQKEADRHYRQGNDYRLAADQQN